MRMSRRMAISSSGASTVTPTYAYTWKKYYVAYNYNIESYENGTLISETTDALDYDTIVLCGGTPGEDFVEGHPSSGDYDAYAFISVGPGNYIEDVGSNSAAMYPLNGESGGYWYIRQ